MNKDNVNKALRNMRVSEFSSKEAAWENIQSRIGVQSEPETPIVEMARSSRKMMWPAVAAIAAIVVAAFLLFGPAEDIQVNTGYASIEKVLLPDGSTVYVNASSQIRFDKADWKENRRVELTGEAEFEVIKGSTFTVSSTHGDVTVLGTSFNVYDRDGEYEVSCMTGKVSVKNDKGIQIILPGEQVVATNDGVLAKKNFTGKPAGWINGEYYFDEVSAVRVFRLLEFTYGIKIDYSGWAECGSTIYAGPVVTNSLEKALQLIGGPSGSLPIEFLSTDDNTYQVVPLNK